MMISTRSELYSVIRYERKLYFQSFYKYLEKVIVRDKDWYIYRFQKYLRYSEYNYNNKKNPVNKIGYCFWRRKKNKLGVKLGIEIWENSISEGLRIWHSGNIVVNGEAKIGKNCQLKGDNCIGNTGYSFEAPCIGDNFSAGNGAKIIGNIIIGDNVTVGAGAVVTKSFNYDGAVLVGVPAKDLGIVK